MSMVNREGVIKTLESEVEALVKHLPPGKDWHAYVVGIVFGPRGMQGFMMAAGADSMPKWKALEVANQLEAKAKQIRERVKAA